MRKLLTGVLVLLMAAGMLVVFTACGGDHELVGIWTWDIDSSVHYVFNADGTGNRGGDSQNIHPSWIQDFRWSIHDDDMLLLRFAEDDIGNELWEMSVSGNVLNLVMYSNRAQNFNYIRVGG